MSARLPRPAAVQFLCLLFAVQAFAVDWPHFLGPDGRQTSPETALLHELPKAGPAIVWQYEKGTGHSTPSVSGSRVVLFHAADGEEIIDCLDAATGARQWRHSYEAKPNAQYGAGAGPRTNPTIASGRVYTLGSAGALHCIELASGKIVWKRDLTKEYSLRETFFGQGGTPLVHAGKVILPLGTEDGKSLVAFDAATGEERWAAKHAWGSSYASPIPAQLHGKDCILAFQGGMSDPPTGGLLVVEADSGKVLSATPHRSRMFASVSVSSPVVAGDRVFVSEAYTEGGLCAEIAKDFSASVAWKAPKFDTYLVTAIAHEGCLYAFAGQHQQNAELVCVDVASGKELWRDDLGGKFQRGSLLRIDGAFLCLGENGDLAWLELSPKGGKVLSQAKIFHAPETWTPPVVSDGRLFICQNQPGSGGTKARLICYDFKAK